MMETRMCIRSFAFIAAAAAYFLSSLNTSAWAFDCRPLEPRGGLSSDASFQGKIKGQIDGVFAKLAGASADVEGAYRQIISDVLKDYPDASRIYIWERIIYLQCGLLNESKADDKTKNEQLDKLIQKFMSGPPNDRSQLDGVKLVATKDRASPTLAREYFDNNTARFDLVISNASDFSNQLTKLGVFTSDFKGETGCGDGGGASVLIPISDYTIEYNPKVPEKVINAEPPIHFDPMSSARITITLKNVSLTCGPKPPPGRMHSWYWSARVSAVLFFGDGTQIRSSKLALSELCVGFNQGLRRGQFVEL